MAAAEETHLVLWRRVLRAFASASLYPDGWRVAHALHPRTDVVSNVHSIVERSRSRGECYATVCSSQFSILSRLAVTLRLCFVACLWPANADERCCAGIMVGGRRLAARPGLMAQPRMDRPARKVSAPAQCQSRVPTSTTGTYALQQVAIPIWHLPGS